MANINLENLLKKSNFLRNDNIISLNKNLTTSDSSGITINEELEILLSESDIDLLIGNEELFILVQDNKLYTAKNTGSVGKYINNIDFNTLTRISYGKSKKKIILMNEGTDFIVKNKEDCIEAIMEEFNAHEDMSINDLLADIEIQGFSAIEVLRITAECLLLGKQ